MDLREDLVFPDYASVSLLAIHGIHLIKILRGRLTQILSIGYTFHTINLNFKKIVCVLAYVFMYRCASV